MPMDKDPKGPAETGARFRGRRGRLIWALALAGAAAGGGWVVYRVVEGRPGQAGPSPRPPATAPALTLAAGRQVTIALPREIGGDGHAVAADSHGRLWIFYTSENVLKGSLHEPGQDKPAATWTISTSAWKYIERQAAVVDARDRPVVFWAGHDGVPGEQAIGMSQWTGQGWTAPRVMDRLGVSESVSHMAALAAGDGGVHLVYNRPLSPREQYSRGFIIVDGAYADKCYHLWRSGDKWMPARPTTGKGRYTVGDVDLSEGPGGRLLLSQVIQPFGAVSYEKGYVACQWWDDKGWGPLRRVTAAERNVAYGGVATDGWGTRHAWWREGPGRAAGYIRPGPDGTAASAETLDDGSKVSFVGDRLGRLFMLRRETRDTLRVWNGVSWSDPLAVPGPLPGLAAGPDAAVFLYGRQGEELVVQEVRVRKAGG